MCSPNHSCRHLEMMNHNNKVFNHNISCKQHTTDNSTNALEYVDYISSDITSNSRRGCQPDKNNIIVFKADVLITFLTVDGTRPMDDQPKKHPDIKGHCTIIQSTANELKEHQSIIEILNNEGKLLWAITVDNVNITILNSLLMCLFRKSSTLSSNNCQLPFHRIGKSDTEDNLLLPFELIVDSVTIAMLLFNTCEDLASFTKCLFITKNKPLKQETHLDSTDSSTIQTYFQYYGKLSNQMNMLQDTIRTKLYRDAIIMNASNFFGTRVMDVGAGSGILSFFSAQAGANIVYVVEASSTATAVKSLAETNPRIGGRLRILNKTVESVDLYKDLNGEKVDILVSEPIGTFLFNERMIESYLYARDMFLKPGGALYPNRCRLFLAPFSDPILYNDFSNRCSFWGNQNFCGVNLSAVWDRAIEEQFRQPVVGMWTMRILYKYYIDPASLVCGVWHQETFDLATITRESLSHMIFHFRFPIATACLVHGIAGWFDVLFEDGQHHLGFSTAPWSPPTHWYQIRFVFRHPLAVNPDQVVVGSLEMTGNTQQSYYITVTAKIEGTDISTSTEIIDLKDPDYRYYSNPQASYNPTTSQSLNSVHPLIPTPNNESVHTKRNQTTDVASSISLLDETII